MRYEFICDNCGNKKEFFNPISEGPPKEVTCDQCNDFMRHVFGGNFILRGTGWPGKDLKAAERAMDQSREKNEAQASEDNSKQRIVEEVTAERRKGREATRKLKEEKPQKMTDYKKAIKDGYRAKPKSYEIKKI